MSLKDGVSVIKDFFSLAKDLFLGVLIGGLLLWPSKLNDKLQQAGFTQGNFGILTWQAAQTAQNVSQAKQDVQDVTGALENVAADPKYARDHTLRQVLEKLKSSEANITSADSALKATVAQQQSTAQGTVSKQPVSQGWMMLGRIDEGRQRWVTTNINVPVGSSYTSSAGQEYQTTETVYLRTESVAGQRAAGTIASVVGLGTKVKVLQVDAQSHALAGGWFVWAQVTVEKA